MEETIKKILTPGKGIWAADASPNSMTKRLESFGIEASDQNRFKFRELTISTPGIGDYISGIILHDEAIRNEKIRQLVENQGIVMGIKVDGGTKDLTNFPGELISEGLDGLREKLLEYKNLGAKFAKWRAVFSIGDNTPTQTCINANSEVLARYASLCQEADMVPVVEPEVLMEGSHDIAVSEVVTALVLKTVFNYLQDHKVILEKILLKPNLVHPGKDNSNKMELKEVVSRTIAVLENCVPAAVPGVVFLSGGDSPEEITMHLNDLNKTQDLPWEIAFSFERAIEGPAMKVWAGKDQNNESAQKVLLHRAKMNGLATLGKYSSDLEKEE